MFFSRPPRPNRKSRLARETVSARAAVWSKRKFELTPAAARKTTRSGRRSRRLRILIGPVAVGERKLPSSVLTATSEISFSHAIVTAYRPRATWPVRHNIADAQSSPSTTKQILSASQTAARKCRPAGRTPRGSVLRVAPSPHVHTRGRSERPPATYTVGRMRWQTGERVHARRLIFPDSASIK